MSGGAAAAAAPNTTSNASPNASPNTEHPQALAGRVVGGMLGADAFSRWLGAEVIEAAPRRSVVRMRVRDEMANGFGTCHGGVTFALADSAFAFACNTGATVCVALDVVVSYPNPARVGDVLTATAEAEAAPRRVGFDRVRVANQRGELVARFRGTAYDTRRPHVATALRETALRETALRDAPVGDTGLDGSTVVIRPATVNAVPAIARHRAAMFRDMGQVDADAVPALEDAVRGWVEAAMADGRDQGWLAEVAGAPAAGAPADGAAVLAAGATWHVVGGAGVEIRAIAPRPVAGGRGVQTAPQALVRDVYVGPAWRGRGVARRVLEALLAWTAERGVSGVVLPASAAGRPLYERLGFVPTNAMCHAPAPPHNLPNTTPT